MGRGKTEKRIESKGKNKEEKYTHEKKMRNIRRIWEGQRCQLD